MFKRIIFLLLLIPSLVSATPSGYGRCTASVSVATSSTQVIASNDVPGGRHYLQVQNTGANPIYCALSTSNVATTTNGFLLPASGGSWFMKAIESANGVILPAPNDDLACIATGGASTAVYCDY